MPDFRSSDETRLHYDVIGDPELPPVIVQAGGPARHPSYLFDMPGFAGLRSLVVLQQRGVGASEPSPTPGAAAWPELAEDIHALRGHLGVDRVDLLGHSAGTRVALSYAARYPDELASLCLVTPPATWLVESTNDTPEIIGRHRDDAWFREFVADSTEFGSETDPAEKARLFKRMMPIAWANWNDTAIAHEQIGDGFPEAAARFNAAPDVNVHALRQQLSAVACPVLVIAGEQDGLTGVEPALALSRLFPNSSSAVLPAAGHYPWAENPNGFAAAISAFYAGQTS